MFKKLGYFSGVIFYLIAVPNSSFAQTTQRVECSYQTTGTFVRGYGNFILGDTVSVDWDFTIDSESGAVPINPVGTSANGEIVFSHPTEGTLSYAIDSIVLRDTDQSDALVVVYGDPQGQLGGVDPELTLQDLIVLSLVNNNLTTGVSDILTSRNYPLDVATLNRFPASGVQLSRAGVAAGVFLNTGFITGGCTQFLGEQIFIDVQPRSYPNIIRLNRPRFRAAIPGSAGNEGFFDTIDKTSFNIQGIPAVGVRRRLSDVTTITDELVIDEAICQTGLADGNADLTVVWDSASVIALFPDAEDGVQIPITIQGTLLDGTPIFGNDFIVIDRGVAP
jgi:hypothetical protein